MFVEDHKFLVIVLIDLFSYYLYKNNHGLLFVLILFQIF